MATLPCKQQNCVAKLTQDISRVSDLLMPNAQCWNVELIDQTFMRWEDEEIKRIHVSGIGQENVYVWPFTSDGEYSVRSAYHLLASGSLMADQASTSLMDQKVWKSIWCIRATNKIRHFIWRAAKDSLPTKENLHKRHIPLDVTCSLCHEQQETLMHALWLCDQAKAVWKSEVSFAVMYKTKFHTFMDLFEVVVGRGSVFHVAWFSTIA